MRPPIDLKNHRLILVCMNFAPSSYLCKAGEWDLQLLRKSSPTNGQHSGINPLSSGMSSYTTFNALLIKNLGVISGSMEELLLLLECLLLIFTGEIWEIHPTFSQALHFTS